MSFTSCSCGPTKMEIGTKVWFPSVWEVGTLDSVLLGNGEQVIAYIIAKDDGTKVAIDMQVAEAFENE